MLSVEVDSQNLTATLRPEGPLSESDFQAAAKAIDPLIEKSGHLNGLVIHTENFPGWESFAALCSHLRFVKEHHKKVNRIAVVTDSALRGFADKLAGHFVQAEIRAFPYDDYEAARSWIAATDED